MHTPLHPYPPPLIVANPVLAMPVYASPPILQGASSNATRCPSQSAKNRGSIHWGHIAFYYLAEQMHRWERFVFRFDKRFASTDALKSIIGECLLPCG